MLFLRFCAICQGVEKTGQNLFIMHNNLQLFYFETTSKKFSFWVSEIYLLKIFEKSEEKQVKK